MTGRQLFDYLDRLGALDLELMVLDGFNGGGEPRDINLGPILEKITNTAAHKNADCEGRVGEMIAVVGYGCY